MDPVGPATNQAGLQENTVTGKDRKKKQNEEGVIKAQNRIKGTKEKRDSKKKTFRPEISRGNNARGQSEERKEGATAGTSKAILR